MLGSGKTTLLQNLLTYCKEKDLRAAIVIND
ncbi:hypothetical protein KHA80_02125 [Anaerobacillus sp. HL2]|nr:hypothetical protein KHA80_02125 [Anaerobacillus sp. HL2]